MRLALAFTLALAASGPAVAQIEEDFSAANRIFGQPTAEGVLADLDGEWLPLTTLANLDGADPDPGLITSFLERFCGNDPARGAVITGLDATSFAMAAPNRGEPVYRFDWVAGSQFHRSFDPAALFTALGVDTLDGQQGAEIRGRTLAATPSAVNIYRVSADLLAIGTPERVEIYGRCG